MMRTNDFVVDPWRVVEHNFPSGRDDEQKLGFLLRYAILAPSSHNTQPWRFAIRDNRILVYVNKDRWLTVADADQRELYTSVGCALENLIISAEHFGYGVSTRYFPERDNHNLVAEVELSPGGRPSPFREPELFGAITSRHTNHKTYQSRNILSIDWQSLLDCVAEDGVSLYLTEDKAIKRAADALVNRADAVLFADTAFRRELGYWIGQGAFGTPWLIGKLSQLAMSYLDLGDWVGKKDFELLMSAPVLGVLCSKDNERETQVKVGQAFERIYLKATTLGIGLQPMSQLTEVPEIKAELGKLIPEEYGFPQQPFRLGYAEPERHHTPRRPVEEAMA
jgi:nitroreductase